MVRYFERRIVGAMKLVSRKAQREYLIATKHLRYIGAQTPSVSYGGSRSSVYFELIERAQTLNDIQQARARYMACHIEKKYALKDEFGGILRILGYRLRRVTLVGKWLERKIRNDDKKMVETKFDYPPDCARIFAPIDDSEKSTTRQE